MSFARELCRGIPRGVPSSLRRAGPGAWCRAGAGEARGARLLQGSRLRQLRWAIPNQVPCRAREGARRERDGLIFVPLVRHHELRREQKRHAQRVEGLVRGVRHNDAGHGLRFLAAGEHGVDLFAHMLIVGFQQARHANPGARARAQRFLRRKATPRTRWASGFRLSL